MGYVNVLWDMDDDPQGNVQHMAQHDVMRDEVEHVLADPAGVEVSRSSGHPIAFGLTQAGRLRVVVYEEVDEETAYPITAFEVD